MLGLTNTNLTNSEHTLTPKHACTGRKHHHAFFATRIEKWIKRTMMLRGNAFDDGVSSRLALTHECVSSGSIYFTH